jgi:hypothetical protein
MIKHGENIRTCNEKVVAYLKTPSLNLARYTGENNGKPQASQQLGRNSIQAPPVQLSVTVI